MRVICLLTRRGYSYRRRWASRAKAGFAAIALAQISGRVHARRRYASSPRRSVQRAAAHEAGHRRCHALLGLLADWLRAEARFLA